MTAPKEPAAAALDAVRHAPGDWPFVVAQLGQSLDGRIATLSGESRWINGSSALDHVHRLRAAVDAVVVGVGTALADDPMLNVRRVPGRHPARVVIDPNGRLPAGMRCLDGADGVRRIVIRAADSESAPGSGASSGTEFVSLPRIDGQLCPRAIVDALYARGLRKLLIEGGASTVSTFIDAGAVDRLHVLVAPMILGSGKTGLSLKPIEKLSSAIRPSATVHVLDDGDVLFDCDLRCDKSGD
jgi:diaminohydroxyphosphoribosylaminopyrimidine deaminase/5-amino-6-(5-phosphoribosylamino)uracil reductase